MPPICTGPDGKGLDPLLSSGNRKADVLRLRRASATCRVTRCEQTPSDEGRFACMSLIITILVIVLIVLAILYFVRRT